MKRYVYVLLMLLMLGGCGVNTVQQTVEENYTNADGNIHAYPLDESTQYLSESIGLYMQYLVLIEDKKTFDKQVDQLMTYFLVEQDELVFIRWLLYEDATVNALIDDVRIITALKEASTLFNKPAYEKLASRIEDTISTVQKPEGIDVDYFDWTYEMPAERITLSYLIDDYFDSKKTKKLLIDVDEEATFFPEYYDVAEQKYIESEEVHLIDQLLIAINREDIGHESNPFENWVISEWKSTGKLFGRYNRETEQATVTYESLAVYYYLNLYFTKINEPTLAKEVLHHTEKIATEDMLAAVHFFDYIQYELLLETNKNN